MSEKPEEKKDLKTQVSEHKGKLILVAVLSAAVTLWNYILVPFALTHGITLPPIPLEKAIQYIMLGGF